MPRYDPSYRAEPPRILVVGDDGTGKSSLSFANCANNNIFLPTLSPAFFIFPSPIDHPDHYYGNTVIFIVDTSSRMEKRQNPFVELTGRVDAVILTYACNERRTFDRLASFWLPELRRLQVKAPVIVCGCKLDLQYEEYNFSMLMRKFPEIETCMECSALNGFQVKKVFVSAQTATCFPTAPLFDREAKTLKPRCMRALKRIFFFFDVDKDGALNDKELNEFQVMCFSAPLEHVDVKGLILEKLPKGVNELGLTLEGFRFLHSLFIQKGQIEHTWIVLRKFGYNNELKLRDDYLSTPRKEALDQSVELTSEAAEFLRGVFNKFDDDKDGVLNGNELEDLFSTAPESPWNGSPYVDVIKRTLLHGMPLSEFLSMWAFMTLLDPARSMAYLTYIGYNCNSLPALHVTRRRLVDREKKQTKRNVFQCFVFGIVGAGKSTLLASVLERDFSETYVSTMGEKYVVNVIDHDKGSKKTLILREIPEDGVEKLLSNNESLAACDVALFVYDRSREDSLSGAIELLIYVARKGKKSGFAMPCLLFEAKSDISSSSSANSDSDLLEMCMDMGVDEPICTSVKEKQMNNVVSRILTAAEHPHLSVPETDKWQHQLVTHAFICLSVGIVFACLVGRR